MRQWRKCKAGMLRRVDFARGPAIVQLLSTFVYRPSELTRGGRIYHVEDIVTGHKDFVGVEYLRKEVR